MRPVLTIVCGALLLAAACSGDDPKAQGEECFASSECADGLTCDFGMSPATCQPNQTPLPDADTRVIDAPANQIDAGPPPIDAPPGTPDARPPAIDAAQPDAPVMQPDAALPDAMAPDAATPDATGTDA